MLKWIQKLIEDAKNRRDFREASRDLVETFEGDIDRMAETFERAGCKVSRMSNGFYLVTTPAGSRVLLRHDAIVLNPYDKDFTS